MGVKHTELDYAMARRIVCAVARYFEKREKDVLGARTPQCCMARHLLTALLHDLCHGATISNVARYLRRHHTTVLHSLQAVDSNPVARAEYAQIRRTLENITGVPDVPPNGKRSRGGAENRQERGI